MSRAEKIITFIRRYYTETGKPPSVAVICENAKLTNREFYESFAGVAEALKAAGVPVAEENIEATRKANQARRAGVAGPQRGFTSHLNEVLEVTLPRRQPRSQEVETISPVMAEMMKDQFLSNAIDRFHQDMEESERKIDNYRAEINGRIAAGEQTEGYFLRRFHEMGYRGETLDEVFLEWRRRERVRIKGVHLESLWRFPDLQDRFEQFTI